MCTTTNIKVNQNAGLFAHGEAFCTTKWMEIIAVYNEIVEKMESALVDNLLLSVAFQSSVPIRQSMLLRMRLYLLLPSVVMVRLVLEH